MILSHYRLIKNKGKSLLCIVAEKWLKRNYIMNGREREGKKRGEIEKAACSAGAGSVWSAGVGRRRAVWRERELERIRAMSGHRGAMSGHRGAVAVA